MAVEIKIISLYSKILEYAWFLMISIQKKFYLKLSKYITITKTKLYLHSQNEMELRQYPDNSRFFKTDKKHTKKKNHFSCKDKKRTEVVFCYSNQIHFYHHSLYYSKVSMF